MEGSSCKIAHEWTFLVSGTSEKLHRETNYQDNIDDHPGRRWHGPLAKLPAPLVELR